MNKPTILIPGYTGRDSNNFGVGNHYLDYFSRFGNVRILMPTDDVVEGDLLVLVGGMDISPSKYGETPNFNTSNADVFKQHFFETQLPNYIGRIPIVGICLGMQSLNVFFGGKLYQNMIFHPQSSKRWETAHLVYPPELFKHGILDKKVTDKTATNYGAAWVNSHHHQAVLLSQLANNFQPLMVAEFDDNYLPGNNLDDLIVESFIDKKNSILGVQWHPEELYDEFTIQMIKDMLSNSLAGNLKVSRRNTSSYDVIKEKKKYIISGGKLSDNIPETPIPVDEYYHPIFDSINKKDDQVNQSEEPSSTL